MALFGHPRNKRKATRRKVGTSAWIRLDGGFALRPCTLIDYSDTGVRFAIDKAENLSNEFTFMMSRDTSRGRRARIKWRRGTEIGAEFV